MMSDEMNPSPATPAADSAPATKTGMFSSSTGKIVAVVAGLGLLAIIVGVAAAIVLSGIADRAVDELEGQIEQSASESTGSDQQTSTGVVALAAGPAPEVAYSELFTFRDIFDPLLKPLPEPTTPTDGTTTDPTTPSTTDTATPYAQGVLYLDGVEAVDRVMKAVLRYNGQTYTLAPGEGIPGTPWEVVSVSSTSVTMLYGDVRVTLAVGQGISK